MSLKKKNLDHKNSLQQNLDPDPGDSYQLPLFDMTWECPTGCVSATLVGVLSVTLAVAQVPGPDGFSTFSDHAALDTPKSAQGSCRTWTAAAAGGVMLGTFALLDQAWYAKYDRSPLHSFDDVGEWLQMDKAGHMFSAYTLGGWGHAGWQRCGTSNREAIVIGGGLGFLFLTGVEVLDGTSSGWGFSWSDMAANAVGTGLFMGQQAGWGEQRIQVKLSAHPTSYADQRPDVLGEGLGERILKDYNGQTIWLSANLWSFQKASSLPEWLSVGFGYSAEGMISAFPQGAEHADIDERYRQYFLSPDIDLTRIRTKSKVLRTVLFVLNGVKVPMPALEFRSNGRVLAHGLYF